MTDGLKPLKTYLPFSNKDSIGVRQLPYSILIPIQSLPPHMTLSLSNARVTSENRSPEPKREGEGKGGGEEAEGKREERRRKGIGRGGEEREGGEHRKEWRGGGETINDYDDHSGMTNSYHYLITRADQVSVQ